MRRSNIAGILSIVVVAGWYYGCTELAWETMYSSLSPDGHARIEVQEDLPRIGPYSVIRIRLKSGIKSTTIVRESDCSFSFAHAVWVGSKFGLFVHGGYCGEIRVAFDLREWIEIPFDTVPFDTVKEAVQQSIIAKHLVSEEELAKAGGDALAWVSADPRAAFDRP